MTHRRIARVFKVKAISPSIKIERHQLQKVNKTPMPSVRLRLCVGKSCLVFCNRENRKLFGLFPGFVRIVPGSISAHFQLFHGAVVQAIDKQFDLCGEEFAKSGSG